MAISELLRNKLIITYRLRPAYASVLASLLSSDVVPYETLAGFLKRHSKNENWNSDMAVKVVISRMRKSRPFIDGTVHIHNATNVGYYLDNDSKKRIFEAIKETANGYTTLA